MLSGKKLARNTERSTSFRAGDRHCRRQDDTFTDCPCQQSFSSESTDYNHQTRHTESTSMYSLTFCVRVITPPQYGRNGTAHAAGASILSPARGVFAGMRSVRVRHACGGPGGLPLGSATHFHSVAIATHVAIATQPMHRLQIRPILYNYGASPTTPASYIRVRTIVWACGRGQTDRHTDARDHNTFLVVYDSREM